MPSSAFEWFTELVKGLGGGRFLLCSQSGDHPENSLAKFNYILEMKVGKKKEIESFYIPGYPLELIIKIW